MVFRKKVICRAGYGPFNFHAIHIDIVEYHTPRGSPAAEPDRQSAVGRWMEKERQMRQHLLVNHAGANGAGNGLAVHHDAANTIKFLHDGNRGVVSLLVINQLSRLLYPRLEIAFCREDLPAAGVYSQSQDNSSPAPSPRELGHVIPGRHANDQIGPQQKSHTGLYSQPGD